jgi:hypothetical protein
MIITALQFIQHADLSVLGDIINPGNGDANWSDMAAGESSAVSMHLDQLGLVLAVLLLPIFPVISVL